MTFWDHLDELRSRLIRIVCVIIITMVTCFFFKEQLFYVIFHPKPDSMNLINVEVTQQFLTHMRVSFWAGIIVSSPYIIYEIFAFVAPALYTAEKNIIIKAVSSSYMLFIAGMLLNYFIIFPFTVSFLGSYQVSTEVVNTITLSSYVSLLVAMSLIMGIVFELPILCWLLAKLGVLRSDFMKKYRRHAIVVILILSAIITPTGDPFTLMLVSIPIFLLWELSILIVKRTESQSIKEL